MVVFVDIAHGRFGKVYISRHIKHMLIGVRYLY